MNSISISVGRPHEVTCYDRRCRERKSTIIIGKDPVEGRAMLSAQHDRNDQSASTAMAASA